MPPCRLLLVPALLLLSAGCSCSELEPLQLEPGCQPLLAGADCMLPYPSDYFLVADPSLPSGSRVELTLASKLRTDRGRSADVGDWRPLDGASRLPVITALLPGRVSGAQLPTILGDPEASLGPHSRTVLVEADTGRRIPHFVDLDPRASSPERRAILLRPLINLQAQTRYVVALRELEDESGGALPAPEGFRRLRDGQTRGDEILHPLAERYEKEIFPVLQKAGVARGPLQLAWDFTTRSDEHAWRDLLAVRELTLAWLEHHPPEIEIKEVRENLFPGLWRSVRGELTVPLFMVSASPGAALHRDAQGKVAQNGTTKVPFLAAVPHSVRDRFGPGRTLAYGHGFFGDRFELEGSATRKLADRLEMVFFAIDWWGMSGADMAIVADGLINRPSHALGFVDRLHQAMSNWMVMLAAMDGPLADHPAFLRPTTPGAPGVVIDASGQSNAGHPLFDGQATHFLGLSNGHMLGGTLGAVAPRLERIVLGVGGAGYSQMMFRSTNFLNLLGLLELSIKDPFDQQKYAATLQGAFDFIDPASYAPLYRDRLPGIPPDRQVLLQVGLGDVSVPNFASFLHARLLDIPLLEPSPRPVWGLGSVQSPHAGSALAVYDFGLDVEAIWREANPDKPQNVVHDGLRLTRGAIEQMDMFLRPGGQVIHACEGICDPE